MQTNSNDTEGCNAPSSSIFNKQKFLSMVGMCKKAGKLAVGFDTSKQKIYSGNAYLLITSNDLSAKTVKEVAFVCTNMKVRYIDADINMYEISQIVRKKTGVLCIMDEGFAKALCKLTNNSYEEECRCL